jgi:hypothetical protein
VSITDQGADTINLGYAGSVQGINSLVLISNPSQSTDLHIDDSADPQRRAVTLDTTGSDGRVSGLAPQDILFDNRADTGLTVETGTGGAAVNVAAASPNTTVILNGHGPNTTVNVGSNGSAQAVQTDVEVNNPPSYTAVTIDDSGDSQKRTWTLSTLNPGATQEYGSVSWGTGSVIYKYSDTSSLTVDTGYGGASDKVYGTGVPTTLSGYGDTTIYVIPDNSNDPNYAGTVESDLTIRNPLGEAVVVADDTGETQPRTVSLQTCPPSAAMASFTARSAA